MNWFERYGIPGLYFVGLTGGWLYAFYAQIIDWENLDTQLGLIAILIAVSLPAGYIISIAGQFVYLNWRRWFFLWKRFRGFLGFHGAALDMLEPDNRNRDEAIIEARTLLLTASRKGALSVHTHTYIRNWIARRMDVVAMNQSLFWATFFAGIIALVICGLQPGHPCDIAVIILIIISVAVVLVAILSIWVLRRQIIEVISGIYRTYR